MLPLSAIRYPLAAVRYPRSGGCNPLSVLSPAKNSCFPCAKLKLEHDGDKRTMTEGSQT